MGPIEIRVPLGALWKTGWIYLIPMAAAMIGVIPSLRTLTASGAAAPVQEGSLLLLAASSFVFYWLAFRLAPGLVRAAQRAEGTKNSWRETRNVNQLCLWTALDLTSVTVIIDAMITASQRDSLAAWTRALEDGASDFTLLTIMDTATSAIGTLLFAWLFFVELALIWMLSQRYRAGAG